MSSSPGNSGPGSLEWRFGNACWQVQQLGREIKLKEEEKKRLLEETMRNITMRFDREIAGLQRKKIEWEERVGRFAKIMQKKGSTDEYFSPKKGDFFAAQHCDGSSNVKGSSSEVIYRRALFTSPTKDEGKGTRAQKGDVVRGGGMCGDGDEDSDTPMEAGNMNQLAKNKAGGRGGFAKKSNGRIVVRNEDGDVCGEGVVRSEEGSMVRQEVQAEGARVQEGEMVRAGDVCGEEDGDTDTPMEAGNRNELAKSKASSMGGIEKNLNGRIVVEWRKPPSGFRSPQDGQSVAIVPKGSPLSTWAKVPTDATFEELEAALDADTDEDAALCDGGAQPVADALPCSNALNATSRNATVQRVADADANVALCDGGAQPVVDASSCGDALNVTSPNAAVQTVADADNLWDDAVDEVALRDMELPDMPVGVEAMSNAAELDDGMGRGEIESNDGMGECGTGSDEVGRPTSGVKKMLMEKAVHGESKGKSKIKKESGVKKRKAEMGVSEEGKQQDDAVQLTGSAPSQTKKLVTKNISGQKKVMVKGKATTNKSGSQMGKVKSMKTDNKGKKPATKNISGQKKDIVKAKAKVMGKAKGIKKNYDGNDDEIGSCVVPNRSSKRVPKPKMMYE